MGKGGGNKGGSPKQGITIGGNISGNPKGDGIGDMIQGAIADAFGFIAASLVVGLTTLAITKVRNKTSSKPKVITNSAYAEPVRIAVRESNATGKGDFGKVKAMIMEHNPDFDEKDRMLNQMIGDALAKLS